MVQRCAFHSSLDIENTMSGRGAGKPRSKAKGSSGRGSGHRMIIDNEEELAIRDRLVEESREARARRRAESDEEEEGGEEAPAGAAGGVKTAAVSAAEVSFITTVCVRFKNRWLTCKIACCRVLKRSRRFSDGLHLLLHRRLIRILTLPSTQLLGKPKA